MFPGSRRNVRGFSLIELLVTLALIIIMFVLLYGHGSASHQRKQKQLCQKNLRTLFLAMDVFATDHEGKFPVRPGAKTSEQALSMLLPKYTSVTEPFICPGSKDDPLPEGENFENRRISYAYYMGRSQSDTSEVLLSDAQINSESKESGAQVFSKHGQKPGNNHHKYGGNYLFGDGHAEMSKATARFALVLTQGVVLLNPKP